MLYSRFKEQSGILQFNHKWTICPSC